MTGNVAAPVPAITSANYDASTGELVITGTNFPTVSPALDVSKFKLGNRALTSASSAGATVSNNTTINITVDGADKTAIDAITGFDVNGTANNGSNSKFDQFIG